jgi:hypothetical protein
MSSLTAACPAAANKAAQARAMRSADLLMIPGIDDIQKNSSPRF